ncbi:MAG: hypothetical protein IT304_08810 [Dehalococcoidia bacterium]|nr:hypothetical protein [Dehalococcoidia bacterium]
MRFWYSALVALPLLFVACGDDDGGTPTTTADGGAFSPVTPTQPSLPTPTPVADTATVVTVVWQDKTYAPTLAELKQLAQTEIDADGKRRGVSFATLAAKVGAQPTAFVTIQGLTADRSRPATVRFALADLATTSVLALDDQGHLDFYSTKVPKEQWMDVITGLAFTAAPAASSGATPTRSP